MHKRGNDSSKPAQQAVLGAILGISFIAVVLLRWLSVGPFTEALSAALDALIIASLLGLTVDPFLKREFFREASTDIFFFWLGYSLPHEINDYLQQFVMDTKLLRRDCVLIWTLSESDDGSVLLELDVSYTFQNVTNEAQEYQQGARITNTAIQEQVTQLRCEAPHFRSLEYDWGPRDFQLLRDAWQVGPQCRIPPQRKLDSLTTGDAENRISFGIKYSSVHGSIGTDSWKTSAPTVNVDVICRPADK